MVSKRTWHSNFPKRTCHSRLSIAAFLMALLAMGVAHAQAGATGQDQASSQESATPSRSEVVATGYLHTLLTAQREYQKKHDEYATSLRALVGSGSFTRRLAETDRRDYTVQFHSTGKAFSVALVPKQFDADHASPWHARRNRSRWSMPIGS